MEMIRVTKPNGLVVVMIGSGACLPEETNHQRINDAICQIQSSEVGKRIAKVSESFPRITLSLK